MKKVTFEKYHCMGNDYLVYDPNKNEMELNEENIRLICDRNFGVGSDGILAGPYLDQEKMYVIRASTWKDENPRANAFSFSIVSIGFKPFG